ncbi:hypothetical protein O181_105376, partial [Austropuccinia psidii MF-1]|nr:hypothetical protein [Austropuccinia psidii MF-1]
MNQLLNVFNGSSIFSKIDLRGAYNLLRIKEGDEHLTCFRTKYSRFEYLFMPFGLTNAPASFQNLVNDIFQDLLDFYVVLYLDDIMVFSKSEAEHVTHVSTVLSRLRANNCFAKASGCLFHVSSVEYLGYVVSFKGLKMDQAKVQQILNWPPPRHLKALQSFLGFAHFYHRFIKNYSKKISSLTSFLKKDSCFALNEEALSQFHQLKEAFTTTPILSHFNPSLPTTVETDASNYALVAVLSYPSRAQLQDQGQGTPWNSLGSQVLKGFSSFEVLTNHSSLKYFISSKVLTRWAKFLSEFHFSITYRPGHLATLPDALSYREGKSNTGTVSLDVSIAVFTVYGRDPQFDSAHITQDTPAGKLSTKIQSVQQDVKRELEAAINQFKRYADKGRASLPVFNPDDMVWLSSKNIKSTRPTKKLSKRQLGPFPILKKVSSHAYHLKLPSQWKFIHPVFHISLLEPVKTSTIPNRHQETPPPIIIVEEEEWEVSQILDSKLKRRKL